MKIYLAPMEGVFDPVTRELFTQIGGFDQCVTEFVRVTSRLLPAKVFYRYSPELRHGGQTSAGVPVFVQLLGSDLGAMAENAAFACELGAPGIDLNFGCPAKTVNRHDGGAALLRDPDRVHQIVSAVRAATPSHIPVTAKVRLGFDRKDLSAEIAKAAFSGGAHRLTIHARTKTDGYRPPAYWEFIPAMREHCPGIEVVANGEIWNVEDAKRCQEVSGCTNLALGRPAFACPDLALQIKAALNGEARPPMSTEELLRVWLPRFVDLSATHKDEYYAVTRAKQWLKYLGRTFPACNGLFEVIKTQKSLPPIRDALAPLA